MTTGHYRQGGGNTEPSLPSQYQSIQAELRKLWIKVNTPRIVPPVPPSEAKWSYSGDVAPVDDVQGARWYVPCDLMLIKMVLSLVSPSAVPYFINTYIENVYIRTTSIASGEYMFEETLQIPVAKGIHMLPELESRDDGTGETLAIVYHWVPL